jgi:hypothetical protein
MTSKDSMKKVKIIVQTVDGKTTIITKTTHYVRNGEKWVKSGPANRESHDSGQDAIEYVSSQLEK